jgi:hypothetical protein
MLLATDSAREAAVNRWGTKVKGRDDLRIVQAQGQESGGTGSRTTERRKLSQLI